MALNLASLTGVNGFRLDGAATDDFSGGSVSSAGDVNGDGFDDLIVGAAGADPAGRYSAGSSYVVFGRAGGFAPTLALSALDGTTGFRLDGAASGDYSGVSVASAGDVNGDGFDDLIVGASGADPAGQSRAGSSYVVFGRAGGFAPTLALSALDGTTGFRLDGAGAGDSSGRSVASAGDVNGDGFDDLIVGASGADPSGQVSAGSSYVVFGRAGGFAPTLALSALDGTTGFRLDGAAAGDYNAVSVASAGDVNGDGFDDLIVGASSADPSGQVSAGSSYVVFGRAGGFAPTLVLSALDGTTGFRLDGAATFDSSGRSVASAGDVNGDGFDDLIVGASGADPAGRYSAGSSYVVFGRAGGFAPTLALSALDGTTGFRLEGAAAGDRSGYSVSSAGDVNGDGFDDLIVGGPGADPAGRLGAGSSYVVFGRAGGFAPRLALSALDGTTGFRLDGAVVGDYSGRSVASAGDVNGDGFDDLIVGASDADPAGRYSGSSYVVFGFRTAVDPTLGGDFALAVAEGGSIAVTRDDLRAADLQSLAGALTFAVDATVAGFVARADAPLTAIGSFTQAEINAGAILFVHDGSESPSAGFTVTVTDGDGNAAGPQAVDVTVAPVNDAPAFLSAVEVDPAADEVAAFLLRAEDADGDALAFTATVTDDLTGEAVDAAAWRLSDNGDGTARFAWTEGAARDGFYTALLSVGDGSATDVTAILFDGTAVFDDPAPRLIVRAGGTGGPTLAPQFEVYVDGVLLGVETIDNPFSGDGLFYRGKEARYRDYAFAVPEELAGDDVVIRYVNDATDPGSGKRLALFVHSVTIDGLTLANDPFGFYLSDRPGPETGRSGFGKPMYWDGVMVFADVEAQAARGVVEVIAAGVGAPGEGPAFSVFADGRRLGRVETPDPVDVEGRPAAEAFDNFRFALPRGLDPTEVRIVYDEAPAAGGVEPALWIDAIVVDGVRREAEEDGFFVPRNFAEGGFGPRELVSASGTLAFADLDVI